MAMRRATTRVGNAAPSSPSAPLGTAVMLGGALCAGLGTLVAHGRLDWPPTQLLGNVYTVAGCLALVGPILLRRREAGDVGLGELIWMVGGLAIWIFDGAAVARGESRSLAWATPLGYQPMGLMILAVGLAAWRCRLGRSSWAWTNVIGWALGVLWVSMAAATLLPARALGLVLRE